MTTTTTTSSHSTAPTWPRWIRWALVGILCALAVSVIHHATGPAPAGPGPRPPLYAQGPYDDLTPDVPTGAGTADIDRSAAEQIAADHGYTRADSIELLPAWRWKSHVALYGDYGLDDINNRIGTSIADLTYAISSMIWWALLAIVEFALNLNLLDQFGRAVNSGYQTFASLFDTGRNGTLLWVILLAGLFAAVRSLARGKAPKVISVALMTVLPLAAITALSASAGNGAGVDAKGSPAWIAAQGLTLTDTVAAELSTAFGALALEGGTSGEQHSNTSRNPNCATYTAVLYSAYDTEARAGNANSPQIASISYLWQRAFLAPWTGSQFGNLEHGGRIACHKLETNRGTSATEQRDIAVAARYGGGGNPPSAELFREQTGGDNEQTRMFGFAACVVDDGTFAATHNGFAGPFGENDTPEQARANASEACANWWQTGQLKVGDSWKYRFRDKDSLMDNTDCSAERREADACKVSTQGESDATEAELNEVRDTVLGYWGHNAGTRMTNGFIAALTAVAYAYSLGAIAIGTIAAQIGLLLCLVLLPAMLAMLAWPTKDGSANAIGVKMLRTTGGFLAGKLVLSLTMGLMLQIILLWESIVNSDGSGLTGILMFLGPIIALVILRTLFSRMGLGDITKLSGALGLTANAMKHTSEKGGWQKAAKAASKDKGPKPHSDLATFGRFAMRSGIKSMDKKHHLSEKLRLADRKTAVTGRKDTQGNVVEYGLAQRAAGFGAALDAARNTRFGQTALGAMLLNDSVTRKAGDDAARSRAASARAAFVKRARQEKRRLEQDRKLSIDDVLARNPGMSKSDAAAHVDEQGYDQRLLGRFDAAGNPLALSGDITSRVDTLSDRVVATAEDYECAPSELDASLIDGTVTPIAGIARRGVKVSATVAAHPAAHLDETVVQARKHFETASAKAALTDHVLAASGFSSINERGEVVYQDMFELAGLKPGSLEANAELAKLADGQPSVFDTVSITVDPAHLRQAVQLATKVEAREKSLLVESKANARQHVLDISTRVEASAHRTQTAAANAEALTSRLGTKFEMDKISDGVAAATNKLLSSVPDAQLDQTLRAAAAALTTSGAVAGHAATVDTAALEQQVSSAVAAALAAREAKLRDRYQQEIAALEAARNQPAGPGTQQASLAAQIDEQLAALTARMQADADTFAAQQAAITNQAKGVLAAIEQAQTDLVSRAAELGTLDDLKVGNVEQSLAAALAEVFQTRADALEMEYMAAIASGPSTVAAREQLAALYAQKEQALTEERRRILNDEMFKLSGTLTRVINEGTAADYQKVTHDIAALLDREAGKVRDAVGSSVQASQTLHAALDADAALSTLAQARWGTGERKITPRDDRLRDFS